MVEFFCSVDYEILVILVILNKSLERIACFMSSEKFTMDKEN